MDPTIGRIVHYTLSQLDAELIAGKRGYASMHAAPVASNAVNAGDVYPAVIVRTFGGHHVNLRVMLDGDDTYWACSRMLGEGPGTWAWPYPYFQSGGAIVGGPGRSGGRTFTGPYYMTTPIESVPGDAA